MSKIEFDRKTLEGLKAQQVDIKARIRKLTKRIRDAERIAARKKEIDEAMALRAALTSGDSETARRMIKELSPAQPQRDQPAQ